MKKFVLPVCLLALGGCATSVADQMETGPVKYRLTSKSPREYLQCRAGPGLEMTDVRIEAMTDPIPGGGWRLFTYIPGNAYFTDILPHEGGAKIGYYKLMGDHCL